MSQWGVAVGMSTIEHEHGWSLTHDAVFNWSLLHLSNAINRLSSFAFEDALGSSVHQRSSLPLCLLYYESGCLLRGVTYDIVHQHKEGRLPVTLRQRKWPAT